MLAAALLALASGQTILEPTHSLEVVTTTTAPIDFMVSYVDYTSTTVTPASSQGAITSATTTTWVAAPSAGTQRQLRRAAFRNKSTTTANRLTFQKDVSGTNYETYQVSLAPGESVRMDGDGEWQVYDSAGIQRVPATTVIDGRTVNILKVGATNEAAGIIHGLFDRTGTPGAWVPGTPGVNGSSVSCNTTADATKAGAPYLPNPASGGYYLTAAIANANTVSVPIVYDLLWYNTGLVVTTTTAQLFTTPTWAARDQEGGTTGEGLQFGIMVTTATTNAAAITNMTAEYTNSDGTGTRTATIASFPATAALGTIVPFQLAAGDRGVQSIQSVTLGTSLLTGAVSVIVFRQVAATPMTVANGGGANNLLNAQPAGARLWNGTCLQSSYLPSTTTATTLVWQGQLTVR
jgi:hypothetical protein